MELIKNNDWKHFLTQAGVSNENIHKYSEQLNAEGVSVDLADSLTQEHLKELGFGLASFAFIRILPLSKFLDSCYFVRVIRFAS